ncbi:MAG: hypothetical protein F4227_05560 [Gammaproteobacteria bacterium]|nr:hypothetical protein [Gammaproteobacteria bacterium]MYF02434.1 hypothetical protein [Gammaproteobacteria bacterium]MYI78036.1 hypothetical protein [Gammaproteobacteria bacterium]
MKNLIILPLILLSVSAFADSRITLGERIILGSVGQTTDESEDSETGFTVESSALGFGASFYNFTEESLYLGASLTQYSGDLDICGALLCISPEGCPDKARLSGDSTATTLTGEIGRDFDKWTPFIGASFASTKLNLRGESESDKEWNFLAGVWLEMRPFKLRGTVYSLDDSDNRTISGGMLFPMTDNIIIGADFGVLLDSDKDGFSFSLQIGRIF